MLVQKFDNKPGYNPNGLIDGVIAQLNLKNDAALARLLRIQQPILSKARSRKAPVTAGLLLRMHETTYIPVSSLRRMMGVKPL